MWSLLEVFNQTDLLKSVSNLQRKEGGGSLLLRLLQVSFTTCLVFCYHADFGTHRNQDKWPAYFIQSMVTSSSLIILYAEINLAYYQNIF